jgi:hypothetical protein
VRDVWFELPEARFLKTVSRILKNCRCHPVWAWDGNWTDASSGRVGLYDNPGSTDGQAGTDPPQKYYTASPRDYAEVDPDELNDYFHRRNKDYTPYALARITQDIHYNSWVIPKGYYLIKPGDAEDGSPQVNLGMLNGPQPSYAPKAMIPIANGPIISPMPSPDPDMSTPNPMPDPNPGSGAHASIKPQANPKKKVYEVLVIKRQGKVIAVVPIHRKQSYYPAHKEKIPSKALAWVEEEDRHPVLKFYYHHWIYSTDFQ